jgi:hypothetical protein
MSDEVKKKVLEHGWRCLMQPTRDAAIALARNGKICISQKGGLFFYPHTTPPK